VDPFKPMPILCKLFRIMTGFDKTRLPHTSNYSTSSSCNLAIPDAIDIEISYCLFTSSLKNLF